MHKVLFSLPDQLVMRMKAAIPERQRSKIIATLLEIEILRREKSLYECALAVENDEALQTDMAAWDVTMNDGLTDDSLKTLSQPKES
jgi:transcriptional regulator CtsR